MAQATLSRRAATDRRARPWRAVRHLDRDPDPSGLDRTAGRHQPGRHRGKAFAAVPEAPLADRAAIIVRQRHMLDFRRPVDAGIPLPPIVHAFSRFANEPPRPSPIPVLAQGRRPSASGSEPANAGERRSTRRFPASAAARRGL
jgi:hypothetical protein